MNNKIGYDGHKIKTLFLNVRDGGKTSLKGTNLNSVSLKISNRPLKVPRH